MRWTADDSPERAAFREELRGWLREVLHQGWMEAIDAGDEAASAEARRAAEAAGWNFLSWMRTIGESGYGAPLWPKEYGGMSGEPWTQQLVREELGRYRLPLFAPNILGVGLAGPTIIAHGTEAQKERYLRKILTGEEIWCQLFSEPGSGSDLASLTTRAVRDGDEWVVNGQKVVRIPDANRVGDVGEGWRCARTTLANERDTIAGVSLDPSSILGGAGKDPWQTFVDGVPDRSDPMVRQRMAQLYIEKEVKEITVFRANSARLRGQDPGPEGSVNKVFNAELNQRRTNFALGAAGPGAVAWLPGDRTAEMRAHAFLRARANTIEGGTSEVLRNQIAERVLGLPREPSRDDLKETSVSSGP